MKADIRVEVVYAHPIERVWQALTTSEGLAAWLMPNDFKPVVGHDFELRTDKAPGFDGIVRCRVLELEPPTRMVWAWCGGKIDTIVTFELSGLDGTRTRFRMHQVGFHGLSGHLARLVLSGGGARIYRERLPAYLDRLDRPDRLDRSDRPGGGAGTVPAGRCVKGWRSLLPGNWKRW